MKLMARTSALWITLLAFMLASCSTAVNLRVEDYSRVDEYQTYRIVTLDNREYTANHLAVKDGVASFTQNGERISIPVDKIALVQQINDNEILTGVIVLGIAAAIVGGLVLLVKQD